MHGFFYVAFRTALLASVLLGSVVTELRASPEETFTEERHLTLLEAIEILLQRNRQVLNLRLDRDEQKFSLAIDEDQFRPKFSVNASTSARRDDAAGDDMASIGGNIAFRLPTGGNIVLGTSKSITGESSSSTASLTQPLLKGAGLDVGRASLHRSRNREMASVLSVRQTVAGLVHSVIQSYRSLIQASMRLKNNEAALERAHDQIKVTQALIRTGRVAKREITRSESTIAQREIALLRAINARDSASLALAGILDLPGSMRLVPDAASHEGLYREDDADNIELESKIREALHNRPEIRKAMLDIENARIDLLLARNSLLPDLSLSARIIQDHETGESDQQAMLNLAIPLNDESMKLVHVRAKNALVKAERGMESLRESISIEVRQAVTEVEIGYRVVQLARQARELAEKNLAVEQAKFGQGLSSTFEVASSQDDLLAAQNEEIDRIIAYRNAQSALHQVLGTTLDVWGVEIETVVP